MTNKKIPYSWPPLLTEPISWDRYKVVEMVTPNALMEHSIQMENCAIAKMDCCMQEEDPIHFLAVLGESGRHVAIKTVIEKTATGTLDIESMGGILGPRNAPVDDLEIDAILTHACREMLKNLSAEKIQERTALRKMKRDSRKSWTP